MAKPSRRSAAGRTANDVPPTDSTAENARRALAVQAATIFAVALGLRALHLWLMRDSLLFQALIGDAWQYDRWAAEIASGQWIGKEVFYQTPLYPYLLAVLYSVFGHDVWIVRIAQAVAGSAACVLLAAASNRFFNARVGWVTGLLMACYPPAIFFDGILQKASLDLLLASLLLWLLSIGRVPPGKVAVLAIGVVMGLFVLNRENAAVLTPVIVVWIGWASWQTSLAAVSTRVAGFALGMALVLVPVGLHNVYVGGTFLLTTSQLGPNFYIGNRHGADGRYVPLRPNRGDARFERTDARELAEEQVGRLLTPREVSAYWFDRALDEIRAHPADWLRLMLRKIQLTIHAQEMVDAEGVQGHAQESLVLGTLYPVFHFGVLLPLAVAGIWFTRATAARLWVLHALRVLFAIGVIVFYVFGRYRYPLVPLCMPFAAAGLVYGWDLVRRFDRHSARELGLALCWAAPFVLICNWPLPPAFNTDVDTTWIGAGTALLDAGRPAEAIQAHKRALEARVSPAAYNNLGLAYRAAGKPGEARRNLSQALEMDPNLPATRVVLALLCAQQGDTAEAVDQLRAVIAVEPDNAQAHAELGWLLSTQGHIAEAIAQLREGVRRDPGSSGAANNLAWILATAPDANLRNPDEAVALAERVCQAVKPSDPMGPASLDTLSAAYAAQGQFDKALTTLRQAIAAAESQGNETLARELNERQQLYEQKSPYRDDSLRGR